MANEQKLLARCISKLDSMSHGLTDARPKSFEKLKNTLIKETQVIYVNQLMIYLLTLDCTVPLKNEEDIHKTDEELDTEIIETVFKVAADQGKQVFVLPCDSDLHQQVGVKLKEWYTQRGRVVDPANPVLEIASACTLDACLDVETIVKRLQQLDVVHQWLELISYKLPDEEAFGELMKVWDKWMEKVKTSLGETSACTYQLFATLIKDANDLIQNCRIEEIGTYCEEMYVSKYPKYKRKAEEVQTEEMETSDENGSAREQILPAIKEEKRRKLLNSPLRLWPVGLDPEVVYVILMLVQSEKKPETMQDLKNFIKSIGDIMYVTSPKYILSNIAKEVNSLSEDEDVIVNVRLGLVQSKKTFQLNDTGALGAVLTFPGKQRPYQGKVNRQMHSNFDRMNTSIDCTKEILCGFQAYALKTAKLLSQRTGAVLLFDDAESNARCRDSLLGYLASLSESNGVSEEEFSKELLRKSFELTAVPAEVLVKLLITDGYLNISEADMSVTYAPGYRKSKYVDTGTAESSYLREWERFYKQTQGPTDVEISTALSDRKRKHKMPAFHFRKRQRIIDI